MNTTGEGLGSVSIFENNNRAFDVVNLQISNISATEVSLQWDKPGGIAVGYQYAYDVGTTPPTDCEIATTVGDFGDTSSGFITGLTSGTTYSFRLCSYDSTPVFSEGHTFTITTP